MASTTAEAFDEFSRRIALTTAQSQKVVERVSRVQTLLSTAFPGTHTLPLRDATLMGSAQRSTIIRPFDDLDVLAVFTNRNGIFEKYRGDSQAFLYRIRETINAKTQVANVGARGQAVRLFYNDGLHVDIAPVFKWSGDGYGLPAGDGTWLTTDPLKQKAWADAREAALNGLFRRRVRMLKRWNAVHSKRLGSWQLEVMVGQSFATMGRDSRDAVSKFFSWAANYIHVGDPDGHGGDLGENLTAVQETAIRDSFASEHKRTVAALDAERRGNHKEAIRLWQVTFGDDFPNYG